MNADDVEEGACHLLSSNRSFNAIFGKVGRIASNDVVMQLIKTKCFPALYHGLEACPLRKSRYNSID